MRTLRQQEPRGEQRRDRVVHYQNFAVQLSGLTQEESYSLSTPLQHINPHSFNLGLEILGSDI